MSTLERSVPACRYDGSPDPLAAALFDLAARFRAATGTAQWAGGDTGPRRFILVTLQVKVAP